MWNCGAAKADLAGPWWVGDTKFTNVCESGQRASFTVWPSASIGKIIQQASPTGSSVSATTVSTTSVPSSTVSNTPDIPEQHKSDDSSGRLSLALGAGLGVPLGMASIGFLAFLLWKIRYQRQSSQLNAGFTPVQQSQDTVMESGHPLSEMAGGEARHEMLVKDGRNVPEIDSRQTYEVFTRG
ncbi:MAG: hypothetical protein Q9226_006602 [Calogaya cf. arnoldii]